MARQKKDAKSATFYLSNEIINKLEEYCEDTGLSKTTAVERFIKKCVDEHDNAKEEKRRINYG